MRGYLRPNHRTSTPGAFVAVDTETLPTPHGGRRDWTVHRLRLGVAICWRLESGTQRSREVFHFTSAQAFWAWLASKLNPRRPLWLWAHNLYFDLTALRFWQVMESGELTAEEPDVIYLPRRARNPAAVRHTGLIATEDPPSIWSGWNRDGARLHCVDTMNWWPASLATLGESLGRPKLEMPAWEAPDEAWRAYCLRDAEIVELAVVKLCAWVRASDLGNMRFSAASQAMAAFRHRFMGPETRIYTPDEAKPQERRAYYPARQLAYFVGHVIRRGTEWWQQVGMREPFERGPVYVLDVSSCYPSVMAGHDYPLRHVKTVAMQSTRECLDWLKVYEACAEVQIDSGDEPYPVRDPEEEGGRVRWCVGRFVTTLCGPELRRALESGHATAVGRVQYYTRGRPFDAFVAWALAGRSDALRVGDGVTASLYKLIANSLHGKFGQRRPRWEVVPGLVAPVPWGHYTSGHGELPGVCSYRSVAYTVQRQGHGEEADASVPIISAYATAYARERMRGFKRAAEKGNVLMEDCDTLHLLQDGYDRLTAAGLVGDGQPGKLRLVGTYEEAEYRGVRHYRLDDQWTIAGLTLKAKRDEEGRWVQSVIDGPDATISRGPLSGPLEIERIVSDPIPYVPGVVGPFGRVRYPERGRRGATKAQG